MASDITSSPLQERVALPKSAAMRPSRPLAVTTVAATVLLAFIPSPDFSQLNIGPVTIHIYGICIALGVLAAVSLASRRWVALGGKADDVTALAMWGVPAGLLGARAYHVATDWHLYRDEPFRAFEIWDGGLSIWGGVTAGVIVGLFAAKRLQLPLAQMLDVAAPALPLAQAIGRIGNYFNQELFGRPTNLPWGLEVDPSHRPTSFIDEATFHPTFLYESLWNLALCGSLMMIGRRMRLAPGNLFALYLAGYTAARFFIEQLRVDDATMLAGLRFNSWTSLVVFASALGYVVVSHARRSRSTSVPLAK